MNDLVLKSKQDEIERIAESDIFWAAAKNRQLIHRNIIKGDIYQFEFGKNYVPEMSYEHRGLVIGQSRQLLYVLPIFSLNLSRTDHRDAYHPIDNPSSKSDLFLLKVSEFSFLSHDSVLKLNDIRSVSTARIKYKQPGGNIPSSSPTFVAIEELVCSKYFHSFYYDCKKKEQDNQTLQQKISEQTNIIAGLNSDNAKLKSDVEELQVRKGKDEAFHKYITEILNTNISYEEMVLQIRKYLSENK